MAVARLFKRQASPTVLQVGASFTDRPHRDRYGHRTDAQLLRVPGGRRRRTPDRAALHFSDRKGATIVEAQILRQDAALACDGCRRLEFERSAGLTRASSGGIIPHALDNRLNGRHR